MDIMALIVHYDDALQVTSRQSKINPNNCINLTMIPSLIGDDPLTGMSVPLQVNDVQGVTCKASAGFFTLSFQGITTKNIPFNAPFDTEGTFMSFQHFIQTSILNHIFAHMLCIRCQSKTNNRKCTELFRSVTKCWSTWNCCY